LKRALVYDQGRGSLRFLARRKIMGSKLLMSLVLVMALSASAALATTTAYFSYDRSIDPDIALESGLMMQWVGGAAGDVDVDLIHGYSGGALSMIPDAWLVYWGDDYTQTFNATQGSIEMMVAPNWAGTNQGGGGVGGAGAWQNMLSVGGTASNLFGGGLHIGIFNNGYPSDGGQLFVFYVDSGGNYKDLNSSSLQPGVDIDGNPTGVYGTTKDWVAGAWHKVGFVWNAQWLSMYLDDQLVDTASRPDPTLHPFGAGFWVGGGTDDGVTGTVTWDGYIDELTITDVPEPATIALLGLGALALIRKKRAL
jgi:hypothetical protein